MKNQPSKREVKDQAKGSATNAQRTAPDTRTVCFDVQIQGPKDLRFRE